MVGAIVVAAIIIGVIAALWFTRSAKTGPGAGADLLLDEKAHQLDEAFRERPPTDY